MTADSHVAAECRPVVKRDNHVIRGLEFPDPTSQFLERAKVVSITGNDLINNA
jgi:hypothetical protein